MGSHSEPNQYLEARLVFALAGHRPPSSALELERLDWRRLIAIADNENASIAVHEFFRHRPSKIPPKYARALAFMALDLRHQMQRLEKRLEESIAALSDAGIRVTLLKGAAMALTVYDSFAARPMHDLDILVDAHDAAEARRVLLQSGWAVDPGLPGDEAYFGHHHLSPLIDTAGTGRRMELHTAILPKEHPFDLPRRLDERTRPVVVGEAAARILSTEDHAVHIATHWIWSHEVRDGAWHAIRDLTTLFARRALTVEDFINAAIRWRAGTCAYWTLRLARRLAGLVVPDDALCRIEPRTRESVLWRLERHFERMLLCHADICPSARISRALWSLAVRPSQSGHGRSRPWRLSSERRRLRAPCAKLPSARSGSNKLSRAMGGIYYLLNFV